MAQLTRIGTHRTTVSNSLDLVNPDRGTITKVTYHSTDVVTFDELTIVLDTGGYLTVTTKTRMNQASNQFGLGYHVYQKVGKWYVSTPGIQENVEFPASGRVQFPREGK